MPPLDADEIERLILKYTNLEREQHNLPPLRYDARISEVARAHSEDMAANGYLHYLHGAGPIERGKAAGFGCGFGENIHEHPQRMGDYWLDTEEMARALVRDWMNSPNHRVNILGLGHSIGIGVFITDTQDYSFAFAGGFHSYRTQVVYATQNFYAC